MDIFTHSVFGALLYILFLKDLTFEYFHIAIFFSLLPDLDIFLIPLKRIVKSNYLEHRGGSHSYIIGIIISAILSVVYSTFRNRPFLITWIIGSVFYGLHVSMDLLTTTKIPYLFPISKKEYSFYVEKAGSLFTMLNSVAFLIFLGILYINSADIFLYSTIINIYTYFFIIYYFYRIISKVWISSNLENNQKYFPGILPFFYVVYNYEIVENEISLNIEKKSHFFTTEEIKNVKIILNTEEMNLFKKGLELCKSNYYYAKWTIFPIFLRNNGIFSIRFFFLETLMNKKTFYIQFDFGIINQQLIGFNQGRGSIQH